MKKGECELCLSALTQKKGELEENEKTALAAHALAWGCDICQEVCPHTAKAKKAGSIYTPVEFFQKDTLATLTADDLFRMTNEEFSSRAYSWRGKDTILRNLAIQEKNT